MAAQPPPPPTPTGAPGKTKPGKTFGFGLQAFKTYPELIPMGVVVSAAVAGGIFYLTYMALKKTDVEFVRNQYGATKSASESVKPQEKRKLHVVQPELYKPIPEVEQLKREIGSFKPTNK